MMGQGFGDEIGNGIIRVVVLAFVVGGAVAIGLYFGLSWVFHHIAMEWK